MISARDDSCRLIFNEAVALTGADYTGDPACARLYLDLGLSGEDYFEFLLWFAEKFDVDLSGLDARHLSPSEGALENIIPKKYIHLTVKDFMSLAESGSWRESSIMKQKTYK